MLNYKIEGGSMPVVICYPEAGQSLYTQRGSMSWMSPNMKMQTNAGGFKKALGRLFSGESIFLNEYTPQGGSGVIAFASSFPGSIVPFNITPGNGIIIQKSAFLAMEKGVDISIYLQKRFSTGFVGGEGFIMQRVTGNGLIFMEIDGYCKEYTLAAGQSIIIDTGYLAAMSESCSMDIQTIKGVKNMFFGGEGFFNTKVTGPGKVYIQTMPAIKMAESLSPYLMSHTADNGGIKINFDNN